MDSKFITPNLFRGDSLPNTQKDHNSPLEKGRTWAEFYKTEGLMAKFNSGGSSRIWDHSLSYLVASHVGYERHSNPKEVTPEQLISNKSPFISFSTTIENAGYFMDRSEKAKLVESSLDEATHFIWDLSSIETTKKAEGHYSFTYSASIENVANFLRQSLQEISTKGHEMDMHALGPRLGELIASAYTHADTSVHFADLIDVVTFLKNDQQRQLDKNLVNRAIQRAEESTEWLLFPRDGGDKAGFSSRFVLNKYLKLHYWAKKIK